MTDEPRHGPSDAGRQSATRFTLSLEDVSHLFEDAGLPRNSRSLQRYCAAGRLDCIKEETVSGLAYFVDPASVSRAIKQLAQLHGLTDEVRHTPTTEAMSHHVDPEISASPVPDTPGDSAADRDKNVHENQDRQSATNADMSGFVAVLERENASLREEKNFYRHQIEVKDTQIAALLERDRETNYLVRGLQTMLAPLLGRGGLDDRPHSAEQPAEGL